MPNLLLPTPEKNKRFKKLLEREIPAPHVTMLRSYCGIRDEDGQGGQLDIPQSVIEEYWKYKILRDRGGDSSAMIPLEFVIICRLAEQQEELKEGDFHESTVIELWKQKKLRKDDPVEFKVGRSWIDGTIRGLTENNTKIVVIQLGDSQQKVMKPADVRLKGHRADGEEKMLDGDDEV